MTPYSVIKHLLIALAIAPGLGACFPITKRAIPFHNARNNQRLQNTAYAVSLEVNETAIEQDRWLKSDSLSLVHQETGESFLVSTGSFLDKTATDITCENCIATIESNGKTYFLTRFNGGGSGHFYFHDLFELTDQSATRVRAAYASCGQVLRENDYLVFPSNEFKCPELFFSLESGPSKIAKFLMGK